MKIFMKVCDVVLDSVWYDPRVRKQINEYVRNDVDLSVVGIEDARFNIEEINQLPCPIHIVKNNYATTRFKILKNVIKKISRFYFLNAEIVRAIIDTKPDIIHANDLDALLPSYIASKKIGAKVIYDTHEIFLENAGIVSNRLFKFFWSIVERCCISKVDLVVFVSHSAADYLVKKYKIKKFLVVTNCCPQIDNSIISNKKNFGFEVLNHGQFYEGRGYDLMVKAAQMTTEPDIIYGLRGFGVMEESLKKYVTDNALSNVKFHPPVKVNELIRFASKSHIGLAITVPYCLNFKLSVSNKIFEYAAAGLPIIMSDIPEHVLLNTKYNIGIILKENTPECLCSAVMKLYTDSSFYHECSKNALRMSKELNWEAEFSKLISFENSLCSSSNWEERWPE